MVCRYNVVTGLISFLLKGNCFFGALYGRCVNPGLLMLVDVIVPGVVNGTLAVMRSELLLLLCSRMSSLNAAFTGRVC